MPNLRIVTKNALRTASVLTASSTAGNLAVASLAAAVKSSLHRFTGTNGSYRATWAAPARIGCVALPFCNWSPTAKMRVRVSKEKSATNLLSNSEGRASTLPAKGGLVADATGPGSFANWLQISTSAPGNTYAYRSAADFPPIGTVATFSMFIIMDDGGAPVIGNNNSTGDFTFIIHGDAEGFSGTSVQNLGGGLYRVSKTKAMTRLNYYFGLAKYAAQSTRGFRVTGSMLEVGDKATSYYQSLDTFASRASVGTYIGSDGLIKTAAANVARMQYDPMNPLAPARLLLEAAATNYCKGSVTLSSAHGWAGAVGTATALTYKGLPYMRVARNASYGYLAGPAFTAVAGSAYTLTFAVRADTSSTIDVGLYDAAAVSFGAGHEVVGQIISGPGTMSPVAGSTARRIISGLSTTEDTIIQVTRVYAAGTATAGIYFYPGGNLTGVVGDAVLITRVQIEAASIIKGSELVTNGLFATDASGWTASNATLSVVGGRLRVTGTSSPATGTAEQTITTVVGQLYEVSATCTAGTTNGYYTVGSSSPYLVDTSASTNRLFVATSTSTKITMRNGGGSTAIGAYAEFGNVTVTPAAIQPVVTSYIPTTTAAATRAADVYTSAPGVRPDGYIDHWQSYDYDSGWVLACPAPAVELEGFTPAQAASAYAYGGGAYARHWLPQQLDATGLSVDITDPSNLQGYLEAACMVAGPVWSPQYNASGTSVSVIDRTEVSRSAAGDQLADPGTLSRKVPVELRKMSPPDRAKFLELVRNSRAYPVLLSVFPEHSDLALERDHMLYGRRTKDSDVAYQFSAVYSTTIEIEEI